GKPAIIGITAALSFSLVAVESAAGLTLIALGPFAALLLAIMLMIFVRELVKQVYDQHQVPLITGILVGLFALDSLWVGILAVAPSQPFLSGIHFTLAIGAVLMNVLILLALFLIIKEVFESIGATPTAGGTLPAGGAEGGARGPPIPPGGGGGGAPAIPRAGAGGTPPLGPTGSSGTILSRPIGPGPIIDVSFRPANSGGLGVSPASIALAGGSETSTILKLREEQELLEEIAILARSMRINLQKNKADRTREENPQIEVQKAILYDKLIALRNRISVKRMLAFERDNPEFKTLIEEINQENSAETANSPTTSQHPTKTSASNDSTKAGMNSEKEKIIQILKEIFKQSKNTFIELITVSSEENIDLEKIERLNTTLKILSGNLMNCKQSYTS
ncbi:MAG: hypothetical protein Q7K43_05210, partial [Candidatus Woesearchaeota archaeon]|nr:hypothetical protein [Candidatus Woesearchaeota archaeon]